MACLFEGRRLLRTLPCAFLYDVATPRYQPGGGGVRQCMRFGGVAPALCRAVAAHVRDDACLWRDAMHSVHAVHFKGKFKPWWLGASRPECSDGLQLGRLHLHANATTDIVPFVGPDDFQWNSAADACVSVRRSLHVFWANRRPVPQRCCGLHVALEAEYRESQKSQQHFENM